MNIVMKTLQTLVVLSTIFFCNAYAEKIEKLGLENGLSNKYILDITQDKNGIFWIATRFGLNRYDGNEFKKYFSSDVNGLNADEINAVFTDTINNKLWIATARKGVSVLDCETNTFKSYQFDPNNQRSIINDGITDITNDASGNIWVASYNNGIDLFDEENQEFIHYNTANVEGLPSNMVWNIVADDSDNIYIAHVDKGFSILSWKNRKATNYQHDPNNPKSLPNNHVKSIFIDSYKNIWVGTENGLALFNPIDESFTVFKNVHNNINSISDSFIASISETKDQKLIIGTALNGINFLDLKQDFNTNSPNQVKFSRIEAGSLDTQLSNAYVKTIYTDTYGNIWLGTFGGGLNFIPSKEKLFKSYIYNPLKEKNNTISHNAIKALTIDDDHKLWLASDGGAIDIISNHKRIKQLNSENSPFSSNNTYSIFKDSKGIIWIGFFDGNIYRYNPRSKSIQAFKEFNTNGVNINRFFEDKDKNIWIGTIHGLHCYNLETEKKSSYYYDNSSLQDDMVLSISEDTYGHLWVGTYTGQIIIFNDKMERLKVFYTRDNLYGVHQLYLDSKGHMWAATGKKLYVYTNWEKEEFRTFGIEDGLEEDYISAVIEGKDNEMWCSTNKGISCINLNNGSVQNFNQYDGIPVGHFMIGAVTKSSNNTIYFGSDNGVCYFNANHENSTEQTPSPYITNISVLKRGENYHGEMIDLPLIKEINLNYSQNTFSLDYNVLDMSYKNQVEFSYSLEGLDNIWYNAKNSNTVTFRNVPHGEYVFHVRSRNKN